MPAQPRKRTTPKATGGPVKVGQAVIVGEHGPEPVAPAQPAACPLCFPSGLPDGAHSVGCEHGVWTAPEA
jgi:hypothetical protein